MDHNNEHSLARGDDIPAEAGFGGAPAPELDPAEYLPDMEGFDMTEAQKIELLETLWSIMRSFVEMGVDVASVDPCGQVFGDYTPDSAGGVASSFSKAVSAPAGRNNKNKEDAPI